MPVSQDLPTTEVATNGTDKSWGVVEDFAISCALKLGGAPGLQQVHSPLVRAKRLLVGHHHLLEKAAHVKEVVHDSHVVLCAPKGAATMLFFLDLVFNKQ